MDHRGHPIAEYSRTDPGRVRPAGHRRHGRPVAVRRYRHHPGRRRLVQPPTDIFITFNEPVLGSSLTPGELEVNGVAATAVTLVNANTVDWSIPSTAYATGIDLPNVVTIGADSMGNQVMDVSGQTLTPYSYTFFTTNVAPYVVSSSIDGSVFSPAPADVTEVVTFSQPMDTAFTTASSFDLYGNYRNVDYAAASFSWDPTGTILTINYASLPDDTYSLTLFASGFENVVGIPLASNYTANFAVALGTAAFPTPLTPVLPMGDLIYTGSDTHVLVTPTDVDSLTLAAQCGRDADLDRHADQFVPATHDHGPRPGWHHRSARPRPRPPASPSRSRPFRPQPPGPTRSRSCDVGGNIGMYSIQAYLNSYVKSGTVEPVDRHGHGSLQQLLLAGSRQRRSPGGCGQPAGKRDQRRRRIRCGKFPQRNP